MLNMCKQWCEKYEKKCEKWCKKWEWFSPLVLRLVVGYVFLTAGWGKLNNLEQTTGFFTQLGIPMAGIMTPFVAGVEFLGGLCLLLGLMSRTVAVPLSITMIVALLTAHKNDIQSISGLLHEVAFLYLVILIGIMGLGSGMLSLDHYWCRNGKK